MKSKILPNKTEEEIKALRSTVIELEMQLEEAFEEIELLKERPDIIIQEKYLPPQIIYIDRWIPQTVPVYPQWAITSGSGLTAIDNLVLCNDFPSGTC